MFNATASIGPYTLVRLLGRGAFGEVWLAERSSTVMTTQVALKLPTHVHADPEVLHREARTWLQASGHPNVVPVLEAEVYDGHMVIACEYVAGGTLESWLAGNGGRAPTIDSAVSMARGILTGLAHLHDAGLVHRDLKPANILLQSGIPRLTDFGLTRVLHRTEQSGDFSGTPAYMAPEAFRGEWTPASDIWAAGIILHEMLAGTLPFSQSDFYTLLLSISSADPTPVSSGIEGPFRVVLSRALNKQAGERFSSADEMAEAMAVALAAKAPQLAASHRRTLHNLPAQTTSFIGRERELNEVRALLVSSRLVTLTGSGGTGKTRLMLRATEAFLERAPSSAASGDFNARSSAGESSVAIGPESFPDGVWLVDLSSLSDPAYVVRAAASVFGIREDPGESLIESLAEQLRVKRLLLLLDNCEHLLDAAAILASTLLASCPGITVCTTSREALSVTGEQVYPIPSLSVPLIPRHGKPISLDRLREFESVRLFAHRAALAMPDFAILGSDVNVVAQLCRKLDGIPLAIELAAARVRSLPVQQIEARLSDRFRLLTGGSRTALPRQQTLRALIDWSYNLLGEEERSLLCRLSVFAAGFSLEAAEQVCDPSINLEPAEGTSDTSDPFRFHIAAHAIPSGSAIMDLLSALVDKSLVVFEQADGRARYRLLESVRQYGLDRLDESRERGRFRRRHFQYFAALAAAAEKRNNGPEEAAWSDALQLDYGNLRLALKFCIGDLRSVREGLSLGSSLQRFWWIRGWSSEGREYLDSLIGLPEALAYPKELAGALNGDGTLAWMQGDFISARTLLERCLALLRESGDQRGVATVLGNLGSLARTVGDLDAARSLQEESLTIRRTVGDKRGIALSLGNLGNVAFSQGDYGAAQRLQEESLAIRTEMGDRQGMALSLTSLGNVAWKKGDTSGARALYERSFGAHRELGDVRGQTFTLINLGTVAHRVKDYCAASEHFAECLNLARQTGGKYEALMAMEGLSLVAASRREHERAAKLAGAAESVRRLIGTPVEPGDEEEHLDHRRALEAALGLDGFADALASGRAMPLDRAIAFALEEAPA